MAKTARAKVDVLIAERLSGIYRNRCPGFNGIPVRELPKPAPPFQCGYAGQAARRLTKCRSPCQFLAEEADRRLASSIYG